MNVFYRYSLTKKKLLSSKNVFTTHNGKPYRHKDAFKRAWATAPKRSGIVRCKLHDLRHTFCSDLFVREKEDIATVMEITGHKDTRMLKRYSHKRGSKKSGNSKTWEALK